MEVFVLPAFVYETPMFCLCKFCNVVSGDTVVYSTFCYAELTIALC